MSGAALPLEGDTGASSRRLLGAAGLLALLVVGIALITQHVFDMRPCPWCVLQRLLFVLVAVVWLALVPPGASRR